MVKTVSDSDGELIADTGPDRRGGDRVAIGQSAWSGAAEVDRGWRRFQRGGHGAPGVWAGGFGGGDRGRQPPVVVVGGGGVRVPQLANAKPLATVAARKLRRLSRTPSGDSAITRLFSSRSARCSGWPGRYDRPRPAIRLKVEPTPAVNT